LAVTLSIHKKSLKQQTMFNKPKTNTPEPTMGTLGNNDNAPTVADANKAKPSIMSTVLDTTNKPSVISEGFAFTGDINSTGILHVEGKASGTVTAHSVNVSARGEIEGEVVCNSLNIKGIFSGVAVCEELVIASSAVVKGSISYKFISVGAGAKVEGELFVNEAGASAPMPTSKIGA
jgi:cytoskeletal protein CcmA (bactofilin family)